MQSVHDVLVVGGGVMGCSVACHLKKLAPRLSVLVAEPDPTYAKASSALSASSIRQQFSVPANIALSQYGFRFFRQIDEHLSTGDPVDIGLVERGYLYLATAESEPALRACHAVQQDCGARTQLLDPAQLRARFPWLEVSDLVLGSLGTQGEGWFDGYALLQAFRRKAKALGVEFRTAAVTSLAFGSSSATAGLSDGGAVACEWVVNAAGPHAAEVAALAGIAIPVQPEKHSVYVFESAQRLPDCPLVVDPTGLYFRPEGSRFIVGPPPSAHAADLPGLEVDHSVFGEFIWPALAHRVPAFEAIRQGSAWAGYYEMNTFDQNALIGPAPGLPRFMLINGFSGHGIQQSPGAGLALAEMMVLGASRTIDVSALSPERLRTGKAVRELNVI